LLEVDSIFYGVIFYATHGKDVNNDAGRVVTILHMRLQISERIWLIVRDTYSRAE